MDLTLRTWKKSASKPPSFYRWHKWTSMDTNRNAYFIMISEGDKNELEAVFDSGMHLKALRKNSGGDAREIKEKGIQ
jgi:hypothetical protein